jgi:predicted nucleotidyltransferase
MDPEIQSLTTEMSKRLVDQGAQATLLTGSHARGTARPDSDVDLVAVGEGPEGWMELRGGRLVSVYWWSAEEVRRRLVDPEKALLAVRAWRDGVVLDDPTGVGAELQREAHDWTWERIDREADAWVAEKLVVWSEYARKLIGAVDDGRLLDAAAIRAQLTVQLAEIFAVHRRLSEESENGFWETVAEAGGQHWRSTLERALRNGDDADATAAAIDLVRILVTETEDLLDDRQRAVIDYALGASRSRG